MEKFYDFTDCPKGHKRYGGSDEKLTIYFNNDRYMLKFPDKIPPQKRNDLNSSSRNNVFSEYVACHIIETMDIPVQETLLGSYKEPEGTEHIVVACKDFCTNGYQLNEFQEYNSSHDERFRDVRYPDINNIIDAIRVYEDSIKDIAVDRFWDTFVIDSILGNFDRHTGNWGYLYNDEVEHEKIKLAPIYDCGSSLYPMIADKGINELLHSPEMIKERIYRYPKAAFSYNGKQISYPEFISSDRVLRDAEASKAIDNIYERYDKKKIDAVIENTPAISDIRKEMYKIMISHRVEEIIIPNLRERHKVSYKSLSAIKESSGNSTNIEKMEKVWDNFFALPKEERNGIEWGGERLRIAVFDDMYLARCKEEGVNPKQEILDHFWRNCVDIQGYEPRYCNKATIDR